MEGTLTPPNIEVESSGSLTPSDFDSDTSIEVIPQSSQKRKIASPQKQFKVEDLNIPLSQYLPLGCFSYKEHVAKILRTNLDWMEEKERLPEPPDSDIPWKALVELWRAHWIRIEISGSKNDLTRRIWRVYILPDDVARRAVDRNSQRLRKALNQILEKIDISPQVWNGHYDGESGSSFDLWATPEDASLFYLFNTLPSPAPSVEAVKDQYSQDAVLELLESHGKVRGLVTPLYPYQRRSAAMMLQREVDPYMQLDPRLETRTGPTGEIFFYGARDRSFLRQPRFYDSTRGGILAETMGLGKTLICIALVLATKGHWPKAPILYSDLKIPARSEVGSLVDMAAATVSRQGIPWRRVFDDIKEKEGLEMGQCIKAMERQVPFYEIPPRPIRSNRSSTICSPPEQIQLCSGTIIVVPKNLIHQWQSELSTHVDDGTLSVLVMESPRVMLPPPADLARYDVVLFSRPRFENEAKKGDDLYESPLGALHWLRIIIDEGHSFSNNNTNAAVVAEKIVRAERRWVVSGTPARDLLGVEVDLDAMTYEGDYEDSKAYRRKSLEQRKGFNAYQEQASGAIKSLGSLASRFLKAEPWAASTEDSARWDDHVFRHEGYQTRTYTSFSTCLRRTLENLVIKTQPEDVERDIDLPALTHKIVRLEPSFYDKLTANIFVLLFTSNAVTSERTDIDYLFHKGSQMHLHRLITNLRQSGFYWTGFLADAVLATVEVTEKFLADPDKSCSREDRQLLIECVDAAKVALASSGWNAVSQTQEMGIFVVNWPDQATDAWAFEGCSDPMLMGLTQAVQAQKHVNNHLSETEPTEGLQAAGVEARLALAEAESEAPTAKAKAKVVAESTKMVKQGVPLSSFHTDQTKLSASGVTTSPGAKKSSKKAAKTTDTQSEEVAQTKPKRSTKRRFSTADSTIDLPPESTLGRVSVVGTTSTKFSYLVDRVLSLHKTEKILIFFDANHQAYYLSQIFDLFAIKHLIYANTLTGEQRGKYVVLFNTDPGHRVLLMDIKQAAHGLNLSSASRVFFLNPVCRPGIEAQAIKRAHRIGQTRPVHVETLVLRNTVEEAMHDRATNMTRHEHMRASKFLEDDDTITRIIQQARAIPVLEEEGMGGGQIARLSVPQQIFGRPGRSGTTATGLEKELFGDEEVGVVEEEVGGEKLGKKRKVPGSRKASARVTGKRKRATEMEDDDGASTETPMERRRKKVSVVVDDDVTTSVSGSGAASGSSSAPTHNAVYSSIFGGSGS